MTTQGEFFGLPPISLPRGIGIDEAGIYGMFFALLPDENAWSDLSRAAHLLLDRFDLRGTTQDPDRLHLTVGLPGSHVRKREPFPDALMRSLERFRSPSIEVVLDRAMLYGADSESLVLVGNTETQHAVADLRSHLANAQARQGIRASRAAYSAHVTIGFVRPVPGLPSDIPPIRFSARRVALMATYPGQHLHRVIHSWPLGA